MATTLANSYAKHDQKNRQADILGFNSNMQKWLLFDYDVEHTFLLNAYLRYRLLVLITHRDNATLFNDYAKNVANTLLLNKTQVTTYAQYWQLYFAINANSSAYPALQKIDRQLRNIIFTLKHLTLAELNQQIAQYDQASITAIQTKIGYQPTDIQDGNYCCDQQRSQYTDAISILAILKYTNCELQDDVAYPFYGGESQRFSERMSEIDKFEFTNYFQPITDNILYYYIGTLYLKKIAENPQYCPYARTFATKVMNREAKISETNLDALYDMLSNKHHKFLYQQMVELCERIKQRILQMPPLSLAEAKELFYNHPRSTNLLNFIIEPIRPPDNYNWQYNFEHRNQHSDLISLLGICYFVDENKPKKQ